MATSVPDVLIRTANQTDAEAMLRVEEAADELFREQGVDLDALKIPQDFEEPTPCDFGLVAEVDGYLVEMIRVTELENDLVAVDQLSVHPSMSRRGIGRALLLATADLCRAPGCSGANARRAARSATNAGSRSRRTPLATVINGRFSGSEMDTP